MSQIVTIDARGLSCPQPALHTKATLDRLTDGTVEVLVDSATSRNNVVRIAERAGWMVSVEPGLEGAFRLTLTK